MATGDFPQIATSAYASTNVPLGSGDFVGMFQTNQGQQDTWAQDLPSPRRAVLLDNAFEKYRQLKSTEVKENEQVSQRRLVQVFIVDPNDNVPLDKCLLYKGDPKLTDLTDQELFFELDIKDILAKHNEYRVTLYDKKIKERKENLEPVKIRELKMTVVEIAKF